MMKTVTKLSEEMEVTVKETQKNALFMEAKLKEAVAKTKRRVRTKDIYDPEYCSYWAGNFRGQWMLLTGQEQHRTGAGPGDYYNDPCLVDRVKALEGVLDMYVEQQARESIAGAKLRRAMAERLQTVQQRLAGCASMYMMSSDVKDTIKQSVDTISKIRKDYELEVPSIYHPTRRGKVATAKRSKTEMALATAKKTVKRASK